MQLDPKLGILIVGAKGAVGSTVIAACLAAKAENNSAIFRLPTDGLDQANADFVDLQDMVIGGWDLNTETLAENLVSHGVVPEAVIKSLGTELDDVIFFDGILLEKNSAVSNLRASRTSNSCVSAQRRQACDQLSEDIRRFKELAGVSEVVVVNLASVERPIINSKSMETLEDFENALDENDESLTSGMIYAYAAISQKCGYVNFTPAVTADVPALEQLAKRNGVVLAGKDGKTGQTLYKTVLASMFQKRGLKVEGWYSTNILGNRDGEILNDQEHVKSKISTKQGVLPSILKYDDFVHQVHIHYYPPRGDLKEAWDNIDFTGWFGVKMQMKVNWLGCDSILAAPLVVDLVRWVHFLQGLGMSGNVKELGSYFKAPVGLEENDFFDQWLLLRSLN